MSAASPDTQSRKWDEAISKYWVNNLKEDEFLSLAYFKVPTAHSTYVNVIWGSEVEDNRYFRFLVSGPGNGREETSVRKLYADELGPE